MAPNILFYSDYCFFSKDVMSLITKKNLVQLFLMVCVDAYRDQLPAFVQSVPTIFTHDRRVLEGESAHNYVDLMQASISHLDDQKESVPTEYSGNGSSWSEGYSYLEPNDQGSSRGMGMGTFVGVEDENRIRVVPEQNDDKGGGYGKGQKPSQLSSYLTSRDNDTEVLRNHQLGKG